MNLRRQLFWIHLAVGCGAAVVVFIMSITGVLLAYERQITRWSDRSFRSALPGAGAQRMPMGAMLTEVSSRYAGLPSAITLRSDATAPAEVSFGRDTILLVDVYSGKVLGEASRGTRAFFESVENWHRWLGTSLAQRPAGRAVTGACNLGFLFLVVSGPFLWLPRKWSWQNVRAVVFFRRGLTGKARDFNWHNVFGIWCAAPLLVIVLSGVVMSYPWVNNLVYRLTGSEVPPQNDNRRPASEPVQGREAARQTNVAALSGLDELWTRAEQQAPAWRSITLRLSQGGRGPFTFAIDTGDGGRPDKRSQLTLDRRTGEVIRWEPFSSYNTGRRLRSWLRFLHTGEAGGIAGESVAAIASAGAAILSWTGLWLACRRWWRWRARRQSKPTPIPEKVQVPEKA
jgi:uncharacterized iron-regulated membrane protein